ncbi:Prefoldin-domain-containing protein [Pseudovirgaria hyperparasitica]|uniref:Prefoldin-domain-containing protein n=1 Tax=Pseudovirgaria hyperparasitica TaxID=470096 RepID=A0A6A6WHV4_9PEZI|nr:Prefoldin-domain-containing protein [Pseudovirgaria hyperparasitica]KAF2761664.1 Prefoldin-domain-containing protein [Pseudovirgaria hyperparasitica]
MSPQQGQQIDLTSLSAQQLSQLKKQLDSELEHLTSSFQSLRTAQSRFRDCLKSIKTVEAQKESGTEARYMHRRTKAHPHLIPLTSSLYVPGHFSHIAPSELSLEGTGSEPELLVDVGTGFFVSKSPKHATEFYNDKIKDLEASLKELEGVINAKGQNSRVVEDVLRQKVLAGQGGGSGEGKEIEAS